MSTPPTAPSSQIITVHPVGFRGSVKWPTLIPATSVIVPDSFEDAGINLFSARRVNEAAATPPRKMSRRDGCDAVFCFSIALYLSVVKYTISEVF
jgi:hypothetical protein